MARSIIRNKVLRVLMVVLMLALPLPWTVFADTTQPSGDGVSLGTGGAYQLSFGNVCAGSSTVSKVLSVQIARSGTYPSPTVFLAGSGTTAPPVRIIPPNPSPAPGLTLSPTNGGTINIPTSWNTAATG